MANSNSNSSIHDILSRLMEQGHEFNVPPNVNPEPSTDPTNLNNRIWQSIVENLINRSRSIPVQPPSQPSHQNRFMPMQSSIQANELINNFVYDYTSSMRDYHDNMRRIIYLLEMLIEPDQTHAPLQNPLPSPLQNPSQTRLSTPTEELLFSYYLFPIQQPTTTQPPINQSNQHEPLTRDQIARYTQTYGYTNEMVSSDTSANVCPITLDPFQVGDVICKIIGCNHVFKRPPLMNWFRRNGRCPICRFELINTVLPTTTPSSHLNRDETPVSPEENTEAHTIESPRQEETIPIPRNTSSSVEGQIEELLRGLFGMENMMQRVLDASGNEMYEFDIPINSLFPGSFFQNSYDTEDTNIPDVD